MAGGVGSGCIALSAGCCRSSKVGPRDVAGCDGPCSLRLRRTHGLQGGPTEGCSGSAGGKRGRCLLLLLKRGRLQLLQLLNSGKTKDGMLQRRRLQVCANAFERSKGAGWPARQATHEAPTADEAVAEQSCRRSCGCWVGRAGAHCSGSAAHGLNGPLQVTARKGCTLNEASIEGLKSDTCFKWVLAGCAQDTSHLQTRRRYGGRPASAHSHIRPAGCLEQAHVVRVRRSSTGCSAPTQVRLRPMSALAAAHSMVDKPIQLTLMSHAVARRAVSASGGLRSMRVYAAWPLGLRRRSVVVAGRPLVEPTLREPDDRAHSMARCAAMLLDGQLARVLAMRRVLLDGVRSGCGVLRCVVGRPHSRYEAVGRTCSQLRTLGAHRPCEHTAGRELGLPAFGGRVSKLFRQLSSGCWDSSPPSGSAADRALSSSTDRSGWTAEPAALAPSNETAVETWLLAARCEAGSTLGLDTASLLHPRP